MPHSESRGSFITARPPLPWTLVGNAADHLLPQLETLYWSGIDEEIDSIVRTLQKWQQPELENISPDEEDLNAPIDGFDTFIAQVIPKAVVTKPSQSSAKQPFDKPTYNEYAKHIQTHAMNLAEELVRSKAKVAVHERLATRPRDRYATTADRRAKLLLQAAGFVDVEKLVEYRSAGRGRVPTPVTPQLVVKEGMIGSRTGIVPLKCCDCRREIRGSMFEKREKEKEKEKEPANRVLVSRHYVVCEDCYWSKHYGDMSFTKIYKHTLCRPPGYSVRKRAHPGESAIAWDRYRAKVGYQSIRKTRLPWKTATVALPLSGAGRATQRFYTSRRKGPDQARRLCPTLFDDVTVGEDWLFEPFKRKSPFGQVHMAVRFGPLVIENGIANAKKGAVITGRDPTFSNTSDILRQDRPGRVHLSVSEGPDSTRQLWSQQRAPPQQPKRFQVILKQVVGVPFTGWALTEAENEIIDLLVSASQPQSEGVIIKAAIKDLKQKVRALLRPWVTVYLQDFATRLLSPDTKLTWHPLENDCLRFCDSLLNGDRLGALMCEPSLAVNGTLQPLYIMSFVCQPGALCEREYPSKRNDDDVASGFVEDYIHRFWYGCHGRSDLIDSLHEYWFDTQAFIPGKHPYAHQKYFPWDCTEMEGRHPSKCGTCSLPKHLWAFPFDSWSLIAMHLARDRNLYPDHDTTTDTGTDIPRTPNEAPLLHGLYPDDTYTNTNPPRTSSAASWLQNRLSILLASSILTDGATAMTQEPLFQQLINAQGNPQEDRTKLGGIDRTQPYSCPSTRRRPANWISLYGTRTTPDHSSSLVQHNEAKGYEAQRDDNRTRRLRTDGRHRPLRRSLGYPITTTRTWRSDSARLVCGAETEVPDSRANCTNTCSSVCCAGARSGGCGGDGGG